MRHYEPAKIVDVRQALEELADCAGEAIAGRSGKDALFALANAYGHQANMDIHTRRL